MTEPQIEHLTAKAAATIESLSFGYVRDAPVVQAVSASLAAGQLCALVGPNAAGKSTLLRLMLGHLAPWSGTIQVGGREVRRLDAARRAAWISYVPQRGSSSFAFTVEQVVAMARTMNGADHAAVESALQTCDLGPLRGRVYPHLSTGQQQRVMLARALAQSAGDGRVMLLDEPASAMDLRHVHRTMQLLVESARSGLAVLAVLHDLNLAARYADQVWLMHEGRLVATGPRQQVMIPQVLEPVYGLRLRAIRPEGYDRDLFIASI